MRRQVESKLYYEVYANGELVHPDVSHYEREITLKVGDKIPYSAVEHGTDTTEGEIKSIEVHIDEDLPFDSTLITIIKIHLG